MDRIVPIIANPIAGAGLAERVRARLEEGLRRAGAEPRWFETRARGDAEAEARRCGGAAAIVVIGGDGTINEVLNGLPLPDAPPLAVVPAGTANVLAKELRVPRAVSVVEQAGQALAQVLSAEARRPERRARAAHTDAARVDWIAPSLAAGRVRHIDVGVADGRRFVLMAGAGFDARIVRVLAQERRGPIRMARYSQWGFKAGIGYALPRIRVTADGREEAADASFVIVASCAAYGGPFTFVPTARPDDGRLDLAIFRGRGWPDLLRWIAAAWLGRADRDRHCRLVRAREARLESADDVDVQVDGDPAGKLPVTCTVLPRALGVLAPG